MSRERHQKLEELFHQALEKPEHLRANFLQEACADDPSLLRDLENLLANDAEGCDPIAGSPGAEAVPERIGPYRIEGVIGEGGFARVYLAEQEEPLRRQVALKILKPGLDTHATLARFEVERQTLARMNHEGIARIHDAGATDQGRPYFVMEWVDGESIIRYCEKNKLDTTARLVLFAAVCDAVHHAHQKGVIHRDLKPSNILVTEVEGRAQVKVIDFGIAKATAVDRAEQTLFTLQGQLIGTPEYMSPEQAGFGPGDIDTRTDIYSLGVVLYELLAGVPPFSPETMRQAGLMEIQRLVRDVDPPRPSTRISREVADGLGVSPRVLLKALRGELDWVVLKAMEKDRERRYLSSADLAADLRRFLENEPLQARPPSNVYRMRKFVRRHKLAMTAAAALLVGMLGLTGGVTTALVESHRQQARTQAALAEAEAVTGFLVEMLGSARPYKGGREVSVRAVLDSTLASLDEDLGDRPLVATRVRRTIGVAYTELGLFPEAEPLLQQAYEDHERLLGPDHPQTLRSLDEVADHCLLQDRNAEAELLYAELHKRYTRSRGATFPLTISALHQRGVALWELSRYEEAELHLRRSWELAQSALDHEGTVYLSFASNLANFFADLGRPEEAEPFLRMVLEARIRIHGQQHPEVLESWNNLAMVYADQGRYRECIPFLSRAHDLQNELLGPGHYESLVTRHNLAAMQTLVFDWEAAESLRTEGVRLSREHRQPGERVFQYQVHNLGLLYLQMGKLAEAEVLLNEAYRLRKEHFGENHRDTYSSVHALGELALLRDDLDTAELLLESNLRGRRELLGEDHPHVLASLVVLARVHQDRGRLAEADSLLEQAYRLAEKKLGIEHRTTLETAAYLGRVRLAQRRTEEVRSLLDPLLEICDRQLATPDPLPGVMRMELGACSVLEDNRIQGARYLAEADDLLDRRFTASTPWIRDLDSWQKVLSETK